MSPGWAFRTSAIRAPIPWAAFTGCGLFVWYKRIQWSDTRHVQNLCSALKIWVCLMKFKEPPWKNPMVDHQFASQKWQFRGLCRIIPFIQTSTFDESLIFLESSHKVVGVGLHLVGHLHWKDARRQDFCWWILAQIWSLVESQGFPHMNFQQIWAVTKTPFLALFVEYDTGF